MASLAAYEQFEDYLDANIYPEDLKFLESQELARQLVEIGYRGTEALRREDFEAKRREYEQQQSKQSEVQAKLVLAYREAGFEHPSELREYPVLQALAEREEAIRNGKLTSILFIRDVNRRNQEISGYIDVAHRLKTEDFTQYYLRKKRLLPRPTDLSYYNWDTQRSAVSSERLLTITDASFISLQLLLCFVAQFYCSSRFGAGSGVQEQA